jgi:hypothetical protein
MRQRQIFKYFSGISSMFTEELPNDETFKPENMPKFRERQINKATKILEGYTPLSKYAEEFKPDYTKVRVKFYITF